MLNTDPRFRSVIADLEKASTGEMVRKALVVYEKPNWENREFDPTHGLYSENSNEEVRLAYGANGYTGALALLESSHYFNVRDLSDPTWNIPPEPGPGVVILDFDPEDGYIDQDGNPVQL